MQVKTQEKEEEAEEEAHNLVGFSRSGGFCAGGHRHRGGQHWVFGHPSNNTTLEKVGSEEKKGGCTTAQRCAVGIGGPLFDLLPSNTSGAVERILYCHSTAKY